MATGNRSRSSSGNKQYRKTNAGRKPATNKKTGTRQTARYEEPLDNSLINEIFLIIMFAVCVFLFLCNFGVVGKFGDIVSDIQFGIFGFMAYIMPIILFVIIAFGSINRGSSAARRKLISGIVLFVLAQMTAELISARAGSMESFQLLPFYTEAAEHHNGGGIIAGILTYLCLQGLSMLGTILLILVLALIALVILTEKSVLNTAKRGGEHIVQARREDARRRQEKYQNTGEQEYFDEDEDIDEEFASAPKSSRERRLSRREQREEERRLLQEEKETERILRMNKKARGVMVDTSLKDSEGAASRVRDDIHEITLQDIEKSSYDLLQEQEFDFGVSTEHSGTHSDAEETMLPKRSGIISDESEKSAYRQKPVEDVSFAGTTESALQREKPKKQDAAEASALEQAMPGVPAKPAKKYMFPPVSLLQKGAGNSAKSNASRNLKETAMKLQQTLNTFGVKVTVTDISQGPAVTRFELQPEVGVKVSKIVGLADDIKLNLAATDIRIEAPIPGKAAVGIEVPNKENSMVAFRDLIEAKEYKDFNSKLAFAVGKDIGGKVVVTDIAKMPHMLIAGATGSGKSVCINTIIMSILYKAHPDDVKMIMVDPKVVELSVYNGIPHLLIPVVTDPKKAAGALHWGVAEMTERYNKFAEFNVRDLKGYNQKAEQMRREGKPDAPASMPQIVIVVDELADLMMVSPGEVEESICRLAQLARAAGIHLIIATQRPSVDVITGLIKANMPSRVAFAVSSGVDSRTILDMNGAEKLLGKGDMLFYPQGYPKPARIQGAFVSDKEVQDVVDFLKDQNVICNYNPDIEEKMKVVQSSGGAACADNTSSVDDYFVEAGKFIIDKDKASIGMLQRVFKIGFNRAARIMDQLCEAGVVGEEEGTKPRKVLMSLEQFENYVEESL